MTTDIASQGVSPTTEPLFPVIKTLPVPDGLPLECAGYVHPVGTILYAAKLSPGWELTLGKYLTTFIYPELYAAIGDVYCPQFLSSTLPLTLWQRIKLYLGLDVKPFDILIPNPLYRPGMFRLPNLGGK